MAAYPIHVNKGKPGLGFGFLSPHAETVPPLRLLLCRSLTSPAKINDHTLFTPTFRLFFSARVNYNHREYVRK